VVGRVDSTSSDLAGAAASDPAAWPDWSLLVADHQAAGRGRAGRTWTTPPRSALTVSVLLRPGLPVSRLGWVPLLAGLAVVEAIAHVSGVRAVVKWPNDVLVPVPGAQDLPGWGTLRKVAGVLAEVVVSDDATTGPAVVVGVGVNVSQRAAELPVPSAASLRAAMGLGAESADGAAPGAGGAPDVPDVDRVALLVALVDRWSALDQRWRATGGDAWAAGLGAECSAACATLGSHVRVDLPGGDVLEGRATGLTGDGALELTDGQGRTRSVLAGDVHHVRTAATPPRLTGSPVPSGPPTSGQWASTGGAGAGGW
jgi:BirA family transcriptional regulator, biotin operon repressor / biotin---[acetyl-CoA-carboxylase] ligase